MGGQHAFFTYSGTSADYGIEDFDFDSLMPKMLHLGCFLLLEKIDEGDGIKILKKAKDYGIETSIDLVSENSDRYSLVLPFTDYLIINELEGGRLTNIEPVIENIPAIAKKLMKLGVKRKVIIYFKEGAVCCSDNGITSVGSMRLPERYIKGTAGEGDAFSPAP